MSETMKKTLKTAAAAIFLALCICVLGTFYGKGPLSVSAEAGQSNVYTVRVETGYLALRTAKAYDYSNEIGKLYTGDTVQVTDYSDAQYWYVYAPTLNRYGYVNCDYLVASGGSVTIAGVPMTVRVETGYLALRNGKSYDYANEIGKMYTGETVYVIDMNDPTYWTVYSPKLGLTGYTNQNYLYTSGGSAAATVSYNAMTVRVETGYLALRTAKAYDASNEIGKLYTGDTVYVEDTSDPQYWYVYAPTLNLEGYVNKDYLTGGTWYTYSLGTWTVRVDSGYLALRTARAFDASNEIGKLYTGQTVQVIDTSYGQYWYVYAPTLGLYGYVNSDYLY